MKAPRTKKNAEIIIFFLLKELMGSYYVMPRTGAS